MATCMQSRHTGSAIIMESKHREILKSNRVYLLDNLQPNAMVDHLMESKLLSEDDLEELRSERKTKEKIRFLLDKIPRKGPDAFDKFIDVLKKTDQEYIANKLLEGISANAGWLHSSEVH